MAKPNLGVFFKNTQRVLSKHTPEILTGIGIAGTITTTILAVRATPKALRGIKEAERDKRDLLTKTEVVKTCWKYYIPAAVTGVASITCLIGANTMNARRTAALAAAYQLSETALVEYRDKVVETIGEKKEQVIQEKVAKEQINKTPINNSEVYITGKGKTLFLDPLSKRYFRSDIDKIRKVENELNRHMIHDICGYTSLNEFYDELGLERIDVGDDLGWNTENLIKLNITPGMTEDEEPCIVVAHYNAPRYGFY